MKTNLKFLQLFIAVAMFSLKSNAQQNTFPILSTSIQTECIANCFGADSLDAISDSSIIQVTMIINLFEVSGVSKINVKLGTTNGGNELLSKSFDFDIFGGVGNGCTYNRSGEVITLGLGNFSGLITYFSEVVIERTDNSLTDAVVFNR